MSWADEPAVPAYGSLKIIHKRGSSCNKTDEKQDKTVKIK